MIINVVWFEFNKSSKLNGSTLQLRSIVKHSVSNAKDCKQNGTVKRHKQSEKKKVQVSLNQCQDFYVKKEL